MTAALRSRTSVMVRGPLPEPLLSARPTMSPLEATAFPVPVIPHRSESCQVDLQASSPFSTNESCSREHLGWRGRRWLRLNCRTRVCKGCVSRVYPEVCVLSPALARWCPCPHFKGEGTGVERITDLPRAHLLITGRAGSGSQV